MEKPTDLFLLALVLMTVWNNQVFSEQDSGPLQIVSVETNQPFPNASNIVVGVASDVLLEVICTSNSSSGTTRWRYAQNDILVSDGLKAFGVTQENGRLRIVPVNTLNTVNMFECVDEDSGATLDVTFVLEDSLFFTQTVPEAVYNGTNLREVCPVPDIPAASVSVNNGEGFSYCEVETERGTFRSRSIRILPEPSFLYEPLNVTASPINNMASAAFSCAVSPTLNLQEITWMFEMMAFGSGNSDMKMPGPMEGPLRTDEASGVTVVSGLSDPGTSILVLESVGNQHEGFYWCVASYTDGIMLTSSPAVLEYSGSSQSSDDIIILFPPDQLTVIEGDPVTIPCVGSNQATPSFTGPTGSAITGSQFGLNIVSITSSQDGEYTCQVEEMTANVTITVEPRTAVSNNGVPAIQVPETTIIEGQVDLLRCITTPLTSTQWLRNIQLVSTAISLRPSLPGVYQCVAMVTNQPENADTGDPRTITYFHVNFINEPVISPSSSMVSLGIDDIITLNCTTLANPLPQLEWFVNNQSIDGCQAATGFMETTFSILTLNVSELIVGENNIICRASHDQGVSPTPGPLTATATVTVEVIFRNPNIEPINPTVIQTGNEQDNLTLTCTIEASPQFPPTIEWARGNQLGVLNGTPVERVGDSLVFTSSLVVFINDLDPGMNQFRCVITQGERNFSPTTTINVQTAPTITPTDPEDVIAIVGDEVTFRCSFQATATPTVTWETANGMTISNDVVIRTTSTESTLKFTVIAGEGEIRGNGSMVRCVAGNVVNPRVESRLAELIVAGVPGSPAPVLISEVNARNVTVSWQEPFSLINISNYIIRVVQTTSNEEQMFNLSANSLQFFVTGLRPNRPHVVYVRAVNRAGEGEETSSEMFTTQEDVPDGPPRSVVTTSTELRTIQVSWQPPEEELQNGLITSYTVQYQIMDAGGPVFQTTVTELSVTLINLVPGTTYLVSVAASTMVGLGPYSPDAQQGTIGLSPTFSTASVPQPDRGVTTTTIPVNLPSSMTGHSHYWVITMKVDDSSPRDQTPSFLNNSTFTNYSTSVPLDTPYIVAEVTSLPQTFTLGDETEVNDFPNLYRNGPLEEGTDYAVFVWGFSPSVPGAMVTKRQTSGGTRQYRVFSTSPFIFVSTASSASIMASMVAIITGTVTGGVALIIVIIMSVILIIVCLKKKTTTEADETIDTFANEAYVTSQRVSTHTYFNPLSTDEVVRDVGFDSESGERVYDYVTVNTMVPQHPAMRHL